MTLNS
jgi:hypothetical protein